MRRMLRALRMSFALAGAAGIIVAGASASASASVSASALVSASASASASPSRSVVPTIVAAGVDDFTFESLDVDYTLSRADDGTSRLRVVETFVAVFPESDQNHGMRRTIPDSYQQHPVFPRLESITDGSGAPRAMETDSEDGEYRMTSAADEFVHGAQTYVFTYTLDNVTGAFADTGDDEFYWDVNGVLWSQPFGRVSATLHVDSALAGQLTGRQACYQGVQDSPQECGGITSTASDDGAVEIHADASGIQPFETLTMAVGFAAGTFAPFDSSYLASPWAWAQGAAALVLLVAFALALITRLRTLRDAPGRPTIIAEYTPPVGSDALLGAVLLGKPSKAIPAEVLEQAVRGSLRIVEGKRTLFGGQKLTAELVDWSKSDQDGHMLLRGLFKGDKSASAKPFEFGRSDQHFATAARRMLSWGEKEVGRRGLRRTVPVWVRLGPVALGVVAAIAVFLFGAAALGAGVAVAIPLAFMLVAVPLVIVIVVLVSRKPLTAKGAELRDHLLGLRTFIEWAEADRIRMLQSPSGAERVPVDANDPRQMLKLYEALLPYAVVFGQEKRWAERIVAFYGTTTPYWYVGSHGFNASSFSAGVGSLSSSASASFSSSTGGSGGGGSAGGGGGGGGGGGV